jgi:hypothetical protein
VSCMPLAPALVAQPFTLDPLAQAPVLRAQVTTAQTSLLVTPLWPFTFLSMQHGTIQQVCKL